MAGQRHQVSEVLDFWFVQSRLRQWFAKDPAFDALLRERFLGLTRRAIAGELDAWNEEPSRGLALVLLLDQFPRQFWRDTAMAFAGDHIPVLAGEVGGAGIAEPLEQRQVPPPALPGLPNASAASARTAALPARLRPPAGRAPQPSGSAPGPGDRPRRPWR
jgi:hypothetical protein